MTKSRIFLVLAVFFIGGAFAASFFRLEKSCLLLLMAGAILVIIINLRDRRAWIAAAGILFFCLGVSRTNLALEKALNGLSNSGSGPAELSALVIRESEISEKYQKIIVREGNGNRILINTDIYPAYEYGDMLKIKCTLEEPKNYDSSGFDYKMYLAKDGIYRICDRPQVILLQKNAGDASYNVILSAKKSFENKLSSIFPDPEGAYLKGLLLGGGGRMTKNLTEAFSRTGTSHTVAVSGFNVTVAAAFLMWVGILLGLWRQQAFWLAVGGIALFVILTGLPASAVRAGIMGSLILWAMKEGRLANSANAILCAASSMLLINPLLLRYDAGFQLSFLATVGIVWLSPLLEKFFWKGRPPQFVRETFILTMAATIFVLPVIVSAFGKFSLVSPAANFLILPAIPHIMLGGFSAGIAGYIFLPLGKLIGFLPYFLLKAEIMAVQWMANLSWASVEIKNFGGQFVAIYYSFLFLLLFVFGKKNKEILNLSDSEN